MKWSNFSYSLLRYILYGALRTRVKIIKKNKYLVWSARGELSKLFLDFAGIQKRMARNCKAAWLHTTSMLTTCHQSLFTCLFFRTEKFKKIKLSLERRRSSSSQLLHLSSSLLSMVQGQLGEQVLPGEQGCVKGDGHMCKCGILCTLSTVSLPEFF